MPNRLWQQAQVSSSLTRWARDGTGVGYDLELVRRVAEDVDVPVIICGGQALWSISVRPFGQVPQQ